MSSYKIPTLPLWLIHATKYWLGQTGSNGCCRVLNFAKVVHSLINTHAQYVIIYITNNIMLNHKQCLIHGIRGPRPRVVAYNCGDNTPLTTPITFLELYMKCWYYFKSHTYSFEKTSNLKIQSPPTSASSCCPPK